LFTVGSVAVGVCVIASMVIVGQAGKKSELKKAAEVVASIAGIVLAICFIAGMTLNSIHERPVVAQERRRNQTSLNRLRLLSRMIPELNPTLMIRLVKSIRSQRS